MRILTGNDLKSGAVVWWDGTGWHPHVDHAVDVGDRADEIIARERTPTAQPKCRQRLISSWARSS